MVQPSEILGVLLAGGQSQRMGTSDKCLSSLAGRPLISYTIERLEPQVAALIVNANGEPRRFRQFGLPVVSDTIAGFAGPLAGILAGMLWAKNYRTETRYIATAPTDTPFMPHNLVKRLSAAIDDEHNVATACCQGQHYPVFGIFPVTSAEDLESFMSEGDSRAVKAWLDRQRAATVDFEPCSPLEPDPFFNINTPEDLEAAEQSIRGLKAPRL